MLRKEKSLFMSGYSGNKKFKMMRPYSTSGKKKYYTIKVNNSTGFNVPPPIAFTMPNNKRMTSGMGNNIEKEQLYENNIQLREELNKTKKELAETKYNVVKREMLLREKEKIIREIIEKNDHEIIDRSKIEKAKDSAKLSSCKEKYNDLKKEYEKEKKENEILRANIKITKIKEYQIENDILRKEFKKIKRLYENNKKILGNYKNVINDLNQFKQKFLEQHSIISSYTKKCDLLNKEIQNLKDERDMLQRDLEKNIKNQKNLKISNNKLRLKNIKYLSQKKMKEDIVFIKKDYEQIIRKLKKEIDSHKVNKPSSEINKQNEVKINSNNFKILKYIEKEKNPENIDKIELYKSLYDDSQMKIAIYEKYFKEKNIKSEDLIKEYGYNGIINSENRVLIINRKNKDKINYNNKDDSNQNPENIKEENGNVKKSEKNEEKKSEKEDEKIFDNKNDESDKSKDKEEILNKNNKEINNIDNINEKNKDNEKKIEYIINKENNKQNSNNNLENKSLTNYNNNNLDAVIKEEEEEEEKRETINHAEEEGKEDIKEDIKEDAQTKISESNISNSNNNTKTMTNALTTYNNNYINNDPNKDEDEDEKLFEEYEKSFYALIHLFLVNFEANHVTIEILENKMKDIFLSFEGKKETSKEEFLAPFINLFLESMNVTQESDRQIVNSFFNDYIDYLKGNTTEFFNELIGLFENIIDFSSFENEDKLLNSLSLNLQKYKKDLEKNLKENDKDGTYIISFENFRKIISDLNITLNEDIMEFLLYKMKSGVPQNYSIFDFNYKIILDCLNRVIEENSEENEKHSESKKDKNSENTIVKNSEDKKMTQKEENLSQKNSEKNTITNKNNENRKKIEVKEKETPSEKKDDDNEEDLDDNEISRKISDKLSNFKNNMLRQGTDLEKECKDKIQKINFEDENFECIDKDDFFEIMENFGVTVEEELKNA